VTCKFNKNQIKNELWRLQPRIQPSGPHPLCFPFLLRHFLFPMHSKHFRKWNRQMSLLQRRNELQNKPTETKSENYETDGREESIYFAQITREEGRSSLHWSWRVNCVLLIKHRFGWLPQVSVRNQGFQLRRVQTHDQWNNFPRLEKFGQRLQRNNSKTPENLRRNSESDQLAGTQNKWSSRSQQITAKRVFPWTVQQTQLLRQQPLEIYWSQRKLPKRKKRAKIRSNYFNK
jgi:hypothetical protein